MTRTHQQRPSDHTRSNRMHVNGRVLPMADEDRAFWTLRRERRR